MRSYCVAVNTDIAVTAASCTSHDANSPRSQGYVADSPLYDDGRLVDQSPLGPVTVLAIAALTVKQQRTPLANSYASPFPDYSFATN